MNVVAKRTPPPKARSPITKRFEVLIDPSVLVNQSNFKDISKGKHPTTIEITNRLTIVIILALKTSDESSSEVSVENIFPYFFIANLNKEQLCTRVECCGVYSRLSILRCACVRGRTLITTTLLMIKVTANCLLSVAALLSTIGELIEVGCIYRRMC